MTDDLAPQNLLADVSRQQRRTRRLVDSNWFTFAVLGAALIVGGLVPDRWGWLFAAAMVGAYVAIALRWRYVGRAFAWAPGSIQLSSFALSAAMFVGDGVWGTQLHGAASTAAISGWTALGMLAFWRLTRSHQCLALAGICLGVGAVELALGTNSALGYGIAFAVWGLVEWVRLGRRAA